MPYIKKEDRKKFETGLTELAAVPETAGELNYLFTRICLDYIHFKGKSYQSFNDIIGALEGCKLELYRREISKYEDKKIEDNGDVY